MRAPEPDVDALLAAQRLLAERGRCAETTQETEGWCWRAFDRWCSRRGVPSLPCGDDTLLAYLREHADEWSWSYAQRLTSAVQGKHRSEGHDSPVTGKVRVHLARVASKKGRVAQPLVDALRVSDLAEVVAAIRQPETTPGPAVALRAAGLVVAAVFELPVDQRADRGLPAGAEVSFHGQHVVVRAPERPGITVDARMEPTFWAILQRARPWLGKAPASGRWKSPGARGVSVALAAARSGLGLAPEFYPHELSRSDLHWLCANLDPDLARRNRNVAYLCVGVLLALRHRDLASNLMIEDCGETPEGFLLPFLRSKTDQQGARPARPLPHVEGPGDPSNPLCPACALKAHLRSLRARGRAAGPVFGTLYAGTWRPMTRQNGRLIVAAGWELAGLPATARISTRSLRAGGATSAREAGWSIEQIATELTLHRLYSEAAGYVRARVPDQFQLRL